MASYMILKQQILVVPDVWKIRCICVTINGTKLSARGLRCIKLVSCFIYVLIYTYSLIETPIPIGFNIYFC